MLFGGKSVCAKEILVSTYDNSEEGWQIFKKERKSLL